MIERELDRYLPFLATTKVLIAAVRAGVGRETAHEVIKEHAVAVALAMREQGAEPDLLDRLAADPRLPLDRAAIDAALADRQSFIGRPAIRSTQWSRRSTRWSPAIPMRPSTRRAPSYDTRGGALAGRLHRPG